MGAQLVERSRRLTGLACVRAITVGYKTLTFISLRTPVARVQPLVAKHGGVCGEREKEEAIHRESQLWYILRYICRRVRHRQVGRFVPRSYIIPYSCPTRVSAGVFSCIVNGVPSFLPLARLHIGMACCTSCMHNITSN